MRNTFTRQEVIDFVNWITYNEKHGKVNPFKEACIINNVSGTSELLDVYHKQIDDKNDFITAQKICETVGYNIIYPEIGETTIYNTVVETEFGDHTMDNLLHNDELFNKFVRKSMNKLIELLEKKNR